MGYTVIKRGIRHCIVCGAEKDLSFFGAYRYKTKQGKPSVRYSSRCRGCESIRRRARYEKKGESERRQARAWKLRTGYDSAEVRRGYAGEMRAAMLLARRASEAKRRAVHGKNPADGTLYIQVMDEAKIGDGWLDAYTGEIIGEPTVDHIVPLSRGGAHDYWNLCVTSKRNNSSKHNKTLLTWLARQ